MRFIERNRKIKMRQKMNLPHLNYGLLQQVRKSEGKRASEVLTL